MKPATYRLTLRALPGDVPAEVRLKRLLKAALRTFQYQCTQAEAIDPDGKYETVSHDTGVRPVTSPAHGSGPFVARKERPAIEPGEDWANFGAGTPENRPPASQ